ncbi:MAG: tRNA U34 5-methylaminomethyl-2-thiouridine-forming methyltransferase MnmC [Flavobacteriaceae bacterium]|jgi:tRNA U34 5-methylaminomethyl-2-thiouridine-forming methyltransferase MnmC
MKREIVKTSDGSTTIFLPEMDETYHSTHGAIQEAEHIFIKNGLIPIQSKTNEPISIFEMGLGTGLNALLTVIHSKGEIEYTGIEAFPVEDDLIADLNYLSLVGAEHTPLFEDIMNAVWDQKVEISHGFSLTKLHKKIQDYTMLKEAYDLIYFDAFGPRAQSEMWNLEILSKMVDGLKSNGVLVTYCAMGQFKRDLKSLGLSVEALPGPPGKREMTLARKS